MEDIAIIGAGGFGREVATTILHNNLNKSSWNLVGFYDDGIATGTSISHYGKVLGGIHSINQISKPLNVVIAIGNPSTRAKIRKIINTPLVSFPNIIYDNIIRCADTNTLKIGQGNIIQAGCWASCDVSIGDFNVFNGETNLGHDVEIGDYNVIMPGVWISGEVKIGNENLIGVSSVILQRLKIGNNVHLGAGAVLLTRPKDGCTYIGNPAKLFRYK